MFVLWEKKESVIKVFNKLNKLASKTEHIGTIFHTKHAAAHKHTEHQLYIHKVNVYEATKLVSLCMSMCKCYDP